MHLLTTVLLLAGMRFGQAPAANPNLYYPPSSIDRPEDRGKRVHTNWVQWFGPLPSPGAVPGRGPFAALPPGPSGGFTPTELRSAYGDTGAGAGIIAIVDGYDDPNALADFNTYSANYGLPVERSKNQTASTNTAFQVVYAAGTQPQTSGGNWEFEEALDIEMAHAMAPRAKIVLVEAASNSWANMLAAVDKAVAIGAKQVSMSWIGSEFNGELAYESHFAARGVSFFAASGDSGSFVGYPSASSHVFSCGGTSLTLDSNGNYGSEAAWNAGGGGPSTQVGVPSFQTLLESYDGAGNRIPLTGRGTPDIAAVADPATPVSVYDSFNGAGWTVVGGTSVATPILAGLMNAENGATRPFEFYWIYRTRRDFHDVITGSNGYKAGIGYDYCTGMGSPITMRAF
ncbi:MAG: S53 family peptidase [Fimbriimonadaceae bacterium]